MGAATRETIETLLVSVLFSEPKIPQLKSARTLIPSAAVSVLFSEPKIPQYPRVLSVGHRVSRFSALQRAENSSICQRPQSEKPQSLFQCSSASRKFLNGFCRTREY